MRKLKVTKKSPNNIHVDNPISGPGTLITAFEKVLVAANGSELEESVLSGVQDSIDLLTSKLSITPMQAIVLAMIIDYNGAITTSTMARFLEIRNIRMLTYMNEIEDLVSRRIIRKNARTIDESVGYEIYPQVLAAFMQNKNYEPPCIANLSLEDFLLHLDRLFRDRTSNDIPDEDFCRDINELCRSNPHLALCKMSSMYDVNLKIVFLYCSTSYVYTGDMNITRFEIETMCGQRTGARIFKSIERGTNDLLKDNLLEYHNNNGVVDTSAVCVAERIREMLNAELNLDWGDDEDEVPQGLLRHEDFVAKEMFYNAKERNSIATLTQMLQPDALEKVQSRLVENGMRKGLACIFYGAPGTGKTETAMQIARLTGRDILQVNIADIKSKWVGGTERNIKAIFKRYSNYCAKCERIPILLFNEADAIISRRTENVERSVDKMENAMQNIILEEMEKLEGILIATTNLTNNMDKAFERRFLYKIEFNKPEPGIRAKIWQSMIKNLELDDALFLAQKYDFSGGQIENIARKQLIRNILYNNTLSLSDVCEDCDAELLNNHKKTCNTVGFVA